MMQRSLSKFSLNGWQRHWKNRPLARDKADTLLLLSACLLVLLPHLAVFAWWVNAGSLGLMLWRGWLTLSGRRLPRAWILIPVALTLMGGIYLTYHTFLGREAGVAMLALLLSCKLLEMHAKRDLYIVIFLSFFLLLTSFFYSQSIASAALALLAVLALLTAQLSFQYTGAVPSLWKRIKLGLTILGLAIPLTLIAFFLFPRIQGPLWGLPGDANAGRSGLSDSMSPGNISKLALSEEIAFRVKLSGATPGKAELYWRGIVLNRYDGRTWSHEDDTKSATLVPDLISHGEILHQDIILEPSGQAWLFALDMPDAAPQLEGMLSSMNSQREMTSSQALNNRIRYQANSYTKYRLQSTLTVRALLPALRLPAGYNPQTLRYAAELQRRISDQQQIINEVLQFFRRENFSYTLEPPLLGVNSIDDFLFGSRAGFCEHYASAFVVLMRASGIPARVVTGYQGGTINNVDGYLEIRQSDAHAWAEVWLNGRGWLRVDPTAAVAPERIRNNLGSTQNSSGLAGLVKLALSNNSWLGSAIQSASMRWSAINNSWNLWVLNYNQARQFDLMRVLGLSEFDWTQLSLIFFLLSASVMTLLALPFMLNRRQISALDRLYLSLCQKLANQGYPRQTHEAPYSYGQRLQTNLSDAQYDPIHRFLSAYSAAKYGKNEQSEASTVKQLKILLAQCR